eukprot:15086.XXX_851398_852055_1 [CDS] Oithona nana genome sequencing.
MRLLPLVKGTLQKFKGGKKNEENEEEIADGFHKTPPGEFPRNGPRSSIVAIVMFYVSKIVTIIGLIMVARAVWFEEDDYQLMTFGVGLCLVTVGVAMMIIVNVLKKCEHDAIITHLENQVQNAKRFRDNTRLLGGTNVPEDKQILVQASNLV